LNYYEHHLGDWAAATGHLTWDEDMAYTRLLRAYYHHEKAIPEGQQYRLAKASTPGQRKAVDQVLSEFFELRDGHYHQKRADAEISRYQDKQRKAKASAEARWSQSARNANASPDAMRTHSEGNALQTPDTRHQEEPKGSSPAVAVPSPAPAAPLKAKDLQAQGIDPQHAADWLALRKAKRLPLTPTAWADTVLEGRKAGLDPAKTVAKAVANNWAGFKASWLANGPGGKPPPSGPSASDPFAGCQ
jgi:uncharacterized protein YdaU (DUF1376 family)